MDYLFTLERRLLENEPMSYQVRFQSEKAFAPVELQEGDNLSNHLNITNSPILFGCRTGICGTCLIEVISTEGAPLHEKSENECDLLPIIANQNPKARLACQIKLNTNITIRPLEQE